MIESHRIPLPPPDKLPLTSPMYICVPMLRLLSRWLCLPRTPGEEHSCFCGRSRQIVWRLPCRQIVGRLPHGSPCADSVHRPLPLYMNIQCWPEALYMSMCEFTHKTPAWSLHGPPYMPPPYILLHVSSRDALSYAQRRLELSSITREYALEFSPARMWAKPCSVCRCRPPASITALTSTPLPVLCRGLVEGCKSCHSACEATSASLTNLPALCRWH